jgi:hypothetical protein
MKSAKPATILFQSCHALFDGLLALPAPAPSIVIPLHTQARGLRLLTMLCYAQMAAENWARL